MHNSYLHAGIQAGVVGALLFTAGIVVLWAFLFRSGILGRIRTAAAPDRALLTQAVLILGFLSARSIFESTAAFYGVDLLLFVPAVAYIYQWDLRQPPSGTMKIFIHTMYYLPDFGSAPVLMDELARSLAAAGHEVEVVTTLPRTRGEEFRGLFYSRRVEGGVVVKRLWTNSVRASRWRGSSPGTSTRPGPCSTCSPSARAMSFS